VGDSESSIEFSVKGLFPDGTRLEAVFGKGQSIVTNGQVRLTLPAREGVILVAAAGDQK
jgi:hypothetical protein